MENGVSLIAIYRQSLEVSPLCLQNLHKIEQNDIYIYIYLVKPVHGVSPIVIVVKVISLKIKQNDVLSKWLSIIVICGQPLKMSPLYWQNPHRIQQDNMYIW